MEGYQDAQRDRTVWREAVGDGKVQAAEKALGSWQQICWTTGGLCSGAHSRTPDTHCRGAGVTWPREKVFLGEVSSGAWLSSKSPGLTLVYIPLWAAGWTRHFLRPFPVWIIPQCQLASQRTLQCPATNLLCQVLPFKSSLKHNHYREETKLMLFGSSPHKSTGSHPGSAIALSIKSGLPRDLRGAEVTSYLNALQVEPSA